MTRVGCFVLHLYCDSPLEASACQARGEPKARDEFTGETRGDAMKAAKRSGWRLSEAGVVPSHDLCPACAKGPSVGRLPGESRTVHAAGPFPPIIVRP